MCVRHALAYFSLSSIYNLFDLRNLSVIDNLHIKSVKEYLDLFGSKNNFTAQVAVDAMLYHYKDIRMVDFYLSVFPKESFILSYDALFISLTTKGYNYVNLRLERDFKFFDGSDETIEIRLELHFEDLKDDTSYDNYISLSRFSDEEEDDEDALSTITDDAYYKLIANEIPSKYELFINYNV